MFIVVGSTNEVKVNAVREIIPHYPIFPMNSVVRGINVSSGVGEQPTTLEETIQGARTRAYKAYTQISESNLGVGIESGLFDVPFSKTGKMDVCACVIFTGMDYSMGLSSAFECPPKVIELVKTQGFDLNEAFHNLGMTDNRKLGNAEGAIGLLTRGRVNRLEYTKQAITMAMIQLENYMMYFN